MSDNLALDPIVNADGAEVSPEDVVTQALTPEKITFTHGGLTYMAYIRKSQVSVRQQNRQNAIVGKIALAAGYKDGERIGGEGDNRAVRFMELLTESQSYLEASAEIAIAATVFQPSGKPATNVPQIAELKKFTTEALIATGAIGEAYIEAVEKALRPTLPAEDGAEVPPKTKKASTTKS